MSRNLTYLLIAFLAFGCWLGYLGWLVANRRPEPILETLGKEFWPSRAWMAASEVLVEVKPAGKGHEVVRVFKAAQGAPNVGEGLPVEASLDLLKRVGEEKGDSSWIIGLEKNSHGGGQAVWGLVGDPMVPGRRGGTPRVVPATPWARAWMPKG